LKHQAGRGAFSKLDPREDSARTTPQSWKCQLEAADFASDRELEGDSQSRLSAARRRALEAHQCGTPRACRATVHGRPSTLVGTDNLILGDGPVEGRSMAEILIETEILVLRQQVIVLNRFARAFCASTHSD